MNFGFNEVAEVSNGGRKQLEGNMIHEVKFDGCELRDIKGVKDPNKTFKVLDIKFSNDEGVFTDTVWEPQPGDEQDTQGTYGPNPSNNKQMMFKFKHLIAAVNPELEGSLENTSFNGWEGVRKFMVDATTPGIGVTTKIKLMDVVKKDQNGNERHEAQFPRYFLSYNRDGKLYMSSNFIGKGTFWTNKELTRIENAKKATPTPVDNQNQNDKPFDFGF